MQEASITGFFVTISYIILIYYGLKLIGRYVFPIFFQSMVKNFEKKVREQQGFQQPVDNSKEGETTIDKKPLQTKESNKNVGEYVDYEDVDE
ncbi:MAG: DUF4834 domain-containing protein [Flavobacteriaceae bacterium]|nr:DUF4834 domain-containing protein [Flavobacteriaceae bacterium]